MELRYPAKILYTVGTSQLMLARADAVECRAVKPRPNSNPDVKHASTTLKDCLSALCGSSPELLADPRTDHSVYALDPLQVPELMVGRGLLTWLMSEPARVVGVIKEDYIDGDEMEVLEVRLSLTPTVAVSRAQHATSLQNISNSHPASANPSPPSTPLTQPTVPQPTRTSVRLRVRSKKESSVTPPPPPQPAKRGRPRKVIPLPPPPEPEIPPASPAPSRSHSRVSSISSLALSQAQAPPASTSSQPKPSSIAGDSIPPMSRTASQVSSPTKTLARLLASSNSPSDPSSGTPLLDSLLERLKASGYLSTPQGIASESMGRSEDSPDAQRQALLTLLKLASSNSAAKSPLSAAPTPAASGFAAPSPRNFTAPSPASLVSAPSPMASTATAPTSSMSGPSPTPSSLGVRKRETDDGEIVEIDLSETKRAKLTEDITAPSPSLSATSPPTSVLSPNQSVTSPNMSLASPNMSLASPNMSVASPNLAAPSPSIWGVASPAPSPNLATPSPAISPAIPAAVLYPYPQPLGPPRTLTTTLSQPNLTFSHPPLQFTSSQPNLPSSASQAKRRRQTAQTDLPPCTGSFITPRDQIGQPRPAPAEPAPAPAAAPAPPRVPTATTPVPVPVPVPAPPPRKPTTVNRAKLPNGKEMSEAEVKGMLAGGYYPSGGLQDEHRRLFGAAGRGKKDADRGLTSSVPPPPPPAPPLPPALAPEPKFTTPPLPLKPRSRASRPREPRPTIPRHSPVAPPVSRLPMMMTSPIRATGVSSNSLPPSFSPLKRLLKNAGVKSLEEVLSKGGVSGLKDEMKREEKREREIVDLTSDADDDDDPPPSGPPRTPPRSPKPLEAPPTSRPRRSAPFRPSTPPRKAHTSPPTARASESPLFKGSADVPLPPSSPPPMSDSDMDGSVKGGRRAGYTSEGGGYSSETGGYDAGVSSDAPPDPDVEMSDTDEELWDETIRPVERDEGGMEHVGSVLGQMQFGLQAEFVNSLGEPHEDLHSLSSLLDMLESQGAPSSDAANSEVELDLSGLDQQTLDLANAGIDLANTGLDFSWLETIGQSGEGMVMEGLIQGDGNAGMEFDSNSLVVEDTVVDGQAQVMSEADLAQLLAAFGSS